MSTKLGTTAPSRALSKYFSWEEATVTTSGIRNIPDGLQVNSNIVQCSTQMDVIRELLGVPVIVHSWYRSPAVNQKAGGVFNSAHLTGWAVDFSCKGLTDYEVCMKICEGGIKFDQLILEPSWVHISFDPKMRGEKLTLKKVGGKYESGLWA